MNAARQREAAKKFVEYWKDKAYEKGEAQPFWLALLRDVFGVDQPEKSIVFEGQVKVDKPNSPTPARQTNFIDARIPKTKVLIEQKSANVDPCKPEKQSDDSTLTPYQQAQRYIIGLPRSEHPRWVVVSNFREFLVNNVRPYNCKDLPVSFVGSMAEHYQSELEEAARSEGFTVGQIVKSPMDGLVKYHCV